MSNVIYKLHQHIYIYEHTDEAVRYKLHLKKMWYNWNIYWLNDIISGIQRGEAVNHGIDIKDWQQINSYNYSLSPLHACSITSVVSNSLQLHGPWPARLLCPWDSPGKNTWSGLPFPSPVIKYEVSEMKLLSQARLFATPRTVAHQAPLSMGFSRQEYWSGLPHLL